MLAATSNKNCRIALAVVFGTVVSGLGAGCLPSFAQVLKPETAHPPAGTSAPTPDVMGAYLAWKKGLQDRGFTFQLNHVGELSRLAAGGARRGSVGGGVLELALDADMEKLARWKGVSIHTNLYWTHGTGLTRSYTQNLLPASNIEALPSLRVSEFWLEQKWAEGAFSVRLGQMAAENEFLTSTYGRQFVNGWISSSVSSLPGGGPIYPLAAPGLRLKYAPDERWAVLAALFNGDPVGPGQKPPQRLNPHGLNFRLGDAPLAIAEVQHRHGINSATPGAIKLGLWHHAGHFGTLRTGARVRANHAIYAVVDQQVAKLEGGASVGVFARISGSPANRNLVNVFWDAGILFAGLVPGRAEDAFGMAIGQGRISTAARDAAVAAGMPRYRARETALEFSYSAQIAANWSVQPHFQRVFHGGGTNDASGRPARAASLFGLRSTLGF